MTLLKTDASGSLEKIFHLNLSLDRLTPCYHINERGIEALIKRLDRSGPDRGAKYWLTAARITELALILAGRYADHCEFQAAGDLLANPRLLRIHRRNRPEPAVKRRHQGILEQFRNPGCSRNAFVRRFRSDFLIEPVRPALLPFLADRLAGSKFVPAGYIETVHCRMGQVAGTIGFLSAGGIRSADALSLHLAAATPETRRFTEAHLCRFDDKDFVDFGKEIKPGRAGVDAGFFPLRFRAGPRGTGERALS